jgi:hypothetical protein
MKFTKEETKKAMQYAMKIRKQYSIKLQCKFNDVSLSHCLKEAYEHIRSLKNNVKKIEKTIFSAKEIQNINGWSQLKNICQEFDYKFKPLGTWNNRYTINCSPEDFEVVKEMIIETV